MLRKEWLWMLVSVLALADKTAETDDEHTLIDLLAKDPTNMLMDLLNKDLTERVEPDDRVD